jgi:sigma-B regulation protein RsbQ
MTSSALVRNHVRVVGSGTRTVVLGHGFGSDQCAWQQQVHALGREFRIVLFDHVGCGNSDPAAWSPTRYRTLYSYAEDLLEILDELDFADIAYVGHSLGAMVGILAAQQDAKRFARMVLLNASPRYLNDGGYYGGFEQADLDALFFAMASNYQAWVASFGLQLLGTHTNSPAADEFILTLSALRPDIALTIARAAFQSDFRAEISTHRVPSLVVQPSDDFAVPTVVGEYLVTHMLSGRIAHIASHGHLPHVTSPDVITGIIRDYLA